MRLGVPQEQTARQQLADLGDRPPVTGVPEIDAALAQLSQLGSAPVAEHYDQLASVHEALNALLNPERPQDVSA
jgi:hypothetical protein